MNVDAPPPPNFRLQYKGVPKQGRIQELKGGGAEVKYVHARKFHAHFGVLRGMPNWEGES